MVVNETVSALEERLTAATATVAVMGMGYVGLPLALSLVDRGYYVTTIDVKPDKVQAINEGRSYIRDIPAAAVRSCLATGRLTATTDDSVLAECDVIFICVPTPFTLQKEPDTSYITQAARRIAAHLREGQLIILRSTSYPGTTEEVLRPILEDTGLRVGREFFLAFAPERIDPGNTRFAIEQVPVVVGGCDPASTRIAEQFLQRIARQVVAVSSSAAAEMAKLLENVFRNVNIALVNQVAQLCDRMGLDVWEVVHAASTKPYGFMAFTPGLVGGHCIPVDPYYLAWKAREYDFHMDFIELAARVNEEMPFYVVNKLLMALHDTRSSNGAHERVLVLGVAFKKDVDDARCSPALKVIELLKRRKVDVIYHDPYVLDVRVNGEHLHSEPLTTEAIKGADCVLILADHSCFDYDAIVEHSPMVFDTRNATRAVTSGRDKIIRL
ncbi:MAG TPA: nucleotide sugar dehydrogenase [Nitrospiraceae bacterium]|nr:nucleotide sugar dehydrogenase [Nitrospiraceae bacterium]